MAILASSSRRHSRALVLLALGGVAAFGGVMACESASSDGASSGAITPSPTATTPPSADGAPPPSIPEDGGTDSAPPPAGPPATCKEMLAANPGAASGFFTFDPDGAGPFPAMSLYCDMSFDSGGWTMLQSFTGADSPGSLNGEGDGGILVKAPEPGSLGGLAGPLVQAIAARSSQVHIRLSFASPAGADKNTWVTSKLPPAGQTTHVMTNLRALDVLTKGTDGGFEDWTGPQATAEKLSWVPLYGGGPGTCLNPVEATKYPSIYWACGNFSSMNLYGPQALARWTYTPSAGNQPMEVYVR